MYRARTNSFVRNPRVLHALLRAVIIASLQPSLGKGVDTPHFYLQASLIVLYVASDAAVGALLASALGDPIAVGAAPASP